MASEAERDGGLTMPLAMRGPALVAQSCRAGVHDGIGIDQAIRDVVTLADGAPGADPAADFPAEAVTHFTRGEPAACQICGITLASRPDHGTWFTLTDTELR
ncbi:hypothetical protein [Bradyrhizobium sp. 21]|uniref:hypothetical protein n=1 Tax=Bradyrhizobium sp. 21 TaxID=2782666 RepID=UPI001FF96B21|nr:hypothetical protein [Bradyrhizobium sp. 21]MCK1388804.1 hypothetical protein [Bradyrhizobium sp. 21]